MLRETLKEGDNGAGWAGSLAFLPLSVRDIAFL